MEDNQLADADFRALVDVIEAVDLRLDLRALGGLPDPAPRTVIFAAVVYALIQSSSASGQYGVGSLFSAPLLAEILNPDATGPQWFAQVEILLKNAPVALP